MPDRFPILGSKPKETIPWAVIAPHEAQADRNHYQTLKRLAERGGLSWAEALAVLTDQKWRRVETGEARAAVLEIVRAFQEPQP